MKTAPSSQSTSAEEAQAIAQEAYIYLYPLILMDITRKQLINLDPKTSPLGGRAMRSPISVHFHQPMRARWCVRISTRFIPARGSI